ncbi:hypothetical protein KEM56_001394 [Ascosphaera pollenicola]|nr:hypothetical protein KEM56_001394 [Ascosphaera pollenicola]
MGQGQSKNSGGGSPGAAAGGDPLQSYPSFSRSDTQGSSRSIRDSLRMKMPSRKSISGDNNNDTFGASPGNLAASSSPRSSASALTPAQSRSENSTPVPGGGSDSTSNGNTSGTAGADKSDVGSVKSSTSGKSAHSNNRRHSSNTSTTDATSNDYDDTSTAGKTSSSGGARSSGMPGAPDPPPSPSHSSTLGRGHSDVLSKQTTGEVEHVSNQPPSIPPLSAIKSKPGESILIRRENQINPVTLDLPSAIPGESAGASSPGMGIGALRSIDLDEMITRLLDAGYSTKVTKAVCLKNAEIVAICTAARELLLSQPALIELSAPVKVVGDVHGQYRDLIRLFEMCGFPPTSNYLFLGDYVDRGKQSLETILLLMCYKLKYPENFFLLRGNHECANVTRVYGFYDECKRRCNIKIWKTFVDTFNCFPIAATVAGKIFCVHGGLSPSLSHMDDIRGIARPTDVPDYGLLNDLLWSDPADTEEDWEPNERGVSYCFGKKVILEFLQRHDFDLVCRAHMVVEDGYEFFQDRILVTVFSAPNYCGEFDNWGAVMSVSAELLCSFELLKPLDSAQLKQHIKKGRNRRHNMLNSPPAIHPAQSY